MTIGFLHKLVNPSRTHHILWNSHRNGSMQTMMVELDSFGRVEMPLWLQHDHTRKRSLWQLGFGMILQCIVFATVGAFTELYS